MTTKKTTKNDKKYSCKYCDFTTCKKTDYTRHCLTQKHKNNVLTTGNNGKNDKAYTCNCCAKSFNDRVGLWRHNKTCNNQKDGNSHTNIVNDTITNDKLIIMLINQCKELRDENKELIEVLKNGTHNTTTNSHNKTFNLQFFLNETCKNAMNITDFVNNIQLQLSDLEKLGDIGYVNGISSIIVKNLKDMDISSRPIHCTDSKRETIYVKDEDKWDKEPKGNPKVRSAIKNITHKNSKLLNEFKEKNPDYNNSSSRVSDKYNKLLIETMGGKGDNDAEKENKIIKNITKEVLVEKE
jgi:hypothetical protein